MISKKKLNDQQKAFEEKLNEQQNAFENQKKVYEGMIIGKSFSYTFFWFSNAFFSESKNRKIAKFECNLKSK